MVGRLSRFFLGFGNFSRDRKLNKIHLHFRSIVLSSSQFTKFADLKSPKVSEVSQMGLCDISICSCLAKRLTKPAIDKLLVERYLKGASIYMPSKISCRIFFLNPSFKDFLVWFSLKDLCSTALTNTPRTRSRKSYMGGILSS